VAFGLAIGFAVGSIPFAWLLHRAVTGRDLRSEGSGNPGATNLQRTIGFGWGAAAAALDAGKGAAAVVLASHLASPAAAIPAACGAVAGHVFTPWLSGRGGKGVATLAGAFAVLAPQAAAESVAVFALVLAVTRTVSLASVLAAASLPVTLVLASAGWPRVAAAMAIALLIAWRHRENFARMRAGTEPRAWGSAPPRWDD